MNLSFAWWNVGLKPPVGNAKEPEPASVLKPWFLYCHLDEILDLDLIAFGEVSDGFVNTISSSFLRAGLKPVSLTAKEGRLIFDCAVFYRYEKLRLLRSRNIVFPHHSGSLKVASRVEFEVVASGETFYFYVSHWPSRMSRPDMGRDELGYALRADINSVFEEEGFSAKIILIGDYNDEPFDKPIFDKLAASRDRQLVLDKPYILYNPFWRALGGSAPYSKGTVISRCHGTYHYRSSQYVTKWFTFDQIIVSSAFMGHSHWHLDEAATRVFSYNDDEQFGIDFFKQFDHLPIHGRVVRHHE